MIHQTSLGLNSRSEANPYNDEGLLPLITAPMSSVVDETNYQIFSDNKIQICFPRTANLDEVYNDPVYKDSFHSLSLDEFKKRYIDNKNPIGSRPHKRCIDTANGNMPALHDAIKQAKEIHGDNLIIMAGNVSSVDAFVELAKTGVDYVRVGIGGGGGCNTTSNTGVGQEDLEELIQIIKRETKRFSEILKTETEIEPFSYSFYDTDNSIFYNVLNYQEIVNLRKTKIVADGISSYIKQCETQYNFNDNGYAAINKLLFAGADLVMVGKLFAQCLESAGEKGVSYYDDFDNEKHGTKYSKEQLLEEFKLGQMAVKYSGMSTQEEQKKYKLTDISIVEKKIADCKETYEITDVTKKAAQGFRNLEIMAKIKPSEGSVSWIPVRWTLDEWLHGSDNQDKAPYLMGWLNSIKSAMSYTGKTNL